MHVIQGQGLIKLILASHLLQQSVDQQIGKKEARLDNLANEVIDEFGT